MRRRGAAQEGIKVRKRIFVAAALAVCLLAAGCSAARFVPGPPTVDLSAGNFPVDTAHLRAVLTDGETALLDGFTQLESADFSGSTCYAELMRYAEEHPDIDVYYTVLAGPVSAENDAESIDLTGLTPEQVPGAAEALQYLPALREAELGAQSEGGALSPADVRLLQQARPDVDFRYVFSVFGRDVSTLDEEVDLSWTQMDDGGQAVRDVLPCLTKCTFVNMDSCGVSNEDMAALRDEFPDVKIVWRVWLGRYYSCRTDVEKVLASAAGAATLTSETAAPLQYCTDVKYLDIGHNEIGDISFVASMPDLEVAILGLNPWTDPSPLANCTKMEYLEIFTCGVNSLEPLANMKELRHLNICYDYGIHDLTPLYGLTNLERVWVGCVTPVPAAQVAELRERLPNCDVNSQVANPATYGWRTHERYYKLREQFGYDTYDYSYYWLDETYDPPES